MSLATAMKTPAGLDQVRKACAFIEQHADASITLARLARHVNVSPFHLQRVFSRIVGISPRAYQDALRGGRFRRGLRDGAQGTGALYGAGYRSSSRVYERQPAGGMTPAVYTRGAQGVEVTYAIADSPLGRLLVAATSKGICSVKRGDKDTALEDDLRREYPAAS